MSSKNLRRVLAATLLAVASLGAAAAAGPIETMTPGRLRVAVYSDFAPYSGEGRGIDEAIGRELAKRLGMEADVVEYTADENMDDDLRNMVWKGHYLGRRPADVMLHVPVDSYLAEKNDKVKIFGPYHLETVAVIRNPQLVPPIAGSAARALEVFTREKIGVERATLADDFLVGVLNGRLRENVVHFKSVAEAVKALENGELAAVMATRSEIEGAATPGTPLQVSTVSMPELRIQNWPLGMAVKADNEDLANALTTAMSEIRRDGTLEKIFREYRVTHHQP